MPRLAPSICPRCNCRKPHGARCACMPALKRVDARPSARQRGYDREWQDAAAAFLRAHPTCACGNPATVVMHVMSIRARPDLRMVRSNWRPGCHACNARDAHAERKGIPDDRGAGRGLTQNRGTARPRIAQNSAEKIGATNADAH